ncbi:hypothetical protein K458DRAFT_389463 [Lentithecium fluviatile CBS 122367]|uniref:Uncharacterized protein n=1 Tax=Lentithecium fluviatile CBS 122367 TaxID=1168545 RepID=A0A6G1J166_9PLEO|nr:hypothetical protein K458DRAFT_389463 [Lentithecium fluviatile CBS 122367]
METLYMCKTRGGRRDFYWSSTFGRWVKYARPQRRGGRLALDGKILSTQRDPWRKISRSGFGLDCLKQQRHTPSVDHASELSKLMKPNDFNSQGDAWVRHDVLVSRLGVYLQARDDLFDTRVVPGDMNSSPPGRQGGPLPAMRQHLGQEDYASNLSMLDNGEYSASVPGDDTRAAELWANASLWLKVDKLAHIHVEIIRTLKKDLERMSEGRLQQNWFDPAMNKFERLANLVLEDLIRPTSALNDMMYRSVAYRDSRISLKLNASLWRLSWITFVFLSLAFLVGFFGMNVDAFKDDPSTKHYFISGVCLMLIVFVLWYCVKYSLSRQYQTRQRQGVYAQLYREFADEHLRDLVDTTSQGCGHASGPSWLDAGLPNCRRMMAIWKFGITWGTRLSYFRWMKAGQARALSTEQIDKLGVNFESRWRHTREIQAEIKSLQPAETDYTFGISNETRSASPAGEDPPHRSRKRDS